MSNRRQQAALQDMGYLPSAGGGLIVRLPKLVSDPDFQVVPVPPVAELLPVFLAVKQLWHWTSANPPFPVSGASSARREILGAAPKKGAGRMNINDILTSRFVRAYDLQGKEPVVTIARVELVAMGKTRERNPSCSLSAKRRGCGSTRPCSARLPRSPARRRRTAGPARSSSSTRRPRRSRTRSSRSCA